jgi:hypothetical protein
MNGLDVPAVKPWHIKLTYEQFDKDGDNVHSGSFEEFYVGPKKYRQSYTGDTLTQTDVATESGLYRSGDQRWPGPVELQVRNEALRPLYRALLPAGNTRPERTELTTATGNLPCVFLRRTDILQSNVMVSSKGARPRGAGVLVTDVIVSDNGLPKFCFDPGTVMLRYTRGRGTDETTYNNFVFFQGHYVARDIAVTHGEKAFLKIHMEELETLSRLSDDRFTPPAGSAGPLGGRVGISSGIMMDEYQTSNIAPALLPGVRGVQGEVHLNFVIGKDGRVIQAEAVDGPAELRKPSVEAMRRFRFRPFLILDQPVEVESSTVFDFH